MASRPYSRRGHAVVRSLILATASLAIVGVLFAVYQYSTGIERPAPSTVESTKPAAIERPDTPRTSPGFEARENFVLGAGQRATIALAGTGRGRYELEVTDYIPRGEPGDEYRDVDLVEPEFRIETDKGQRARIKAAHGVMETKREGAAIVPISGRLWGDVEVAMDRMSEEKRLLLPEDQRDVWPTDDRLILMNFQSITFDRERWTLETDGPFRVSMWEADVDGVGLRLVFNTEDERVELFQILDGGTVTLYGLGGMINPSDAAPEEETTRAQPVDNTNLEDVPPSFQPYVARIDGDVEVQRLEKGEPTQSLDATELSLLFDITGDQEDKLSKGGPLNVTTDAADGESDVSRIDRDDRMTIKWKGRFVVRPDSDESMAEATQRRFHITATGAEVLFTDRKNRITCQRIEAHQESRRIWITASEEQRVAIAFDENASLVARDVFIDQALGLADITGPARIRSASQSGSADDFDLRFEDRGEIAFAPIETGAGEDLIMATLLKSAKLYGDVMLSSDGSMLAADHVSALFDESAESTRAPRLVEARGRVLLAQDDGRVNCRELDIISAKGPAGRMNPRLATARGDVLATKASQTVTARESLAIELVPVQPEPFNPVAAWVGAWRKGHDPAAVNWQEVQAKHNADVGVAPAGMTAVGKVNVFDPAEGLDISAESVAAEFTDTGDISVAQIQGDGHRDAFVRLNDFSIRGPRIDAEDVAARDFSVIGPGRIELTSHVGLDGKRTDHPQNIDVSWTRDMAFRGSRNTARFLGNVHAASRQRKFKPAQTNGDAPNETTEQFLETATLDGDELVIDLVDVEPAATIESTPALWRFAWDRLFQKPAADRRVTAVPLNKEPVFVSAARDVVGVFVQTDAAQRVMSRARLSAEKMTADLRADLVTLPVAGTLLIEDYDVKFITAEDTAPTRTAKAPTFWQRGDSSLPSQTFIAWTGSLSFHAARRRADIREGVTLMYRSGDELALANELLASYAFSPDLLKNAGQRTRMDCGELMIEFGESTAAPASSAGIGGMSIRDIRQLLATGGVYIEDSDFTLEAFRIVKYDASDLLRIFGWGDQPAEIVYRDPSGGARFAAPEFAYDLTSERVHAADGRLTGQ